MRSTVVLAQGGFSQVCRQTDLSPAFFGRVFGVGGASTGCCGFDHNNHLEELRPSALLHFDRARIAEFTVTAESQHRATSL